MSQKEDSSSGLAVTGAKSGSVGKRQRSGDRQTSVCEALGLRLLVFGGLDRVAGVMESWRNSRVVQTANLEPAIHI